MGAAHSSRRPSQSGGPVGSASAGTNETDGMRWLVDGRTRLELPLEFSGVRPEPAALHVVRRHAMSWTRERELPARQNENQETKHQSSAGVRAGVRACLRGPPGAAWPAAGAQGRPPALQWTHEKIRREDHDSCIQFHLLLPQPCLMTMLDSGAMSAMGHEARHEHAVPPGHT